MYRLLASISHNQILGLLLFSCIVSLLSALFAEYFMGLRPCALCMIQRYIFVAAGIVIFVGLIIKKIPKNLTFLFAGVLFLVNVGFAFYQVALEHHWIIDSVFCKTASSFTSATTIEELSKNLMMEDFRDCSKPEATFFGFTIAFYNVFFSFGLFVVSLFGIVKNKILN